MVILETERLIFRAHELGDLEAYCAMETDPDVRRYVGGAPRSRDAAERRFHDEVAANATQRLCLWAMVDKSKDLYIGRAGVYPEHDEIGNEFADQGRLSFFIVPDYWGRGLATEAGRAFVRYGFEELKLSKINTTVQVGNDASIRVIEKLGFQLVRTETGEHRSFYHFELMRS